MTSPALPTVVHNELELLSALVPLADQRIIELGCGAARLARELLLRHPGSEVHGLEVDERQHAKNLARPQPGLHFEVGGAESIAHPADRFDLALMLKSLHHVPMDRMAQALDEVARVLRPGGHLYVSEPVYDGPLNEVVKLYNDEGTVRAAAQAALDEALRGGRWEAVTEHRFATPVSFRDAADFEARMMRPTFADHRIDEAKVAAVTRALTPHLTPTGLHFERPMHVRLLRRR